MDRYRENSMKGVEETSWARSGPVHTALSLAMDGGEDHRLQVDLGSDSLASWSLSRYVTFPGLTFLI